MENLYFAIKNAQSVAQEVATPTNVASVELILRANLQPFPLAADHAFTHIDEGPGIYYFEIKFPFSSKGEFDKFLKSWGTKGGDDLQKATARSYASRAKAHLGKVEKGEFIPFYVGKHRNVQSRVLQHLTGKAISGTYGLKLLSRPEILEGCTLKVGAIVLDIKPSAYFCTEFIEAALRDRLNPIVGKQ